MQLSSIPAKFSIPFANAAGGLFIRAIPTLSQIGIQNGAASLTDGFPPLNFSPVAAGGVPPFGQDMNGILKQITQWSQWQNAGATVPTDTTFQSAVGGYPAGAVLQSRFYSGQFWVNTTDNNANDPDATSFWNPSAASYSVPAGWAPLGDSTGDMDFRPTAESRPNRVRCNGNTIGSASSGATELAAATALALFAWLWTNFSNSQCPVSGGRGVSAIADFNANKTITLLDWRGVGPKGVDTMGGGSTTKLNGVPITSGSATVPGSVVGENLHALITAELAAHTHQYSGVTAIESAAHTHSPTGSSVWAFVLSNQAGFTTGNPGGLASNGAGATSTDSVNHTHTYSGTTDNGTGTGTSHNTTDLCMLVYWWIHL